jgi:hypothetical protein
MRSVVSGVPRMLARCTPGWHPATTGSPSIIGGVQVALYVIGGVLELFGILLSVSPDLVPGARRFSAWLDPRRRRLENRVRRLLHLRPRAQVIEVGAIGSVTTMGNIGLLVTVNPDATVEEKVEFLLRRDRERQEAFGGLAGRVEDVERESVSRDDELGERMEKHVAESLDLAASRFRSIRLIGAVLLAIGLVLSTAGNLAA